MNNSTPSSQPLNVRPRLKLPYTTGDRIADLLSLAFLAFSFIVIYLYWPDLPGRVTTHYNITGQADSWGSKSTLLIFPAIEVLIFLGLALLARFPHIYNYPVTLTAANVARQYHIARAMLKWLRASMLFSFIFCEYIALRSAQISQSALAPWLLITILITPPILIVTVGISAALRAK